MGAVPARSVETGGLPLLRGAALPLALFSGVAHLGAASVLGLMVAGAVPDGVGGVMLPIWAVFSLCVSLAGYWRMEERRRERAASSLVASEICVLASTVIALYPRPVDDGVIAEVFELYRRAQASLEEGDHPGAGEAIERGIALADGLLEGAEPVYGDAPEPGDSVRDEEANKKGAGSWS